VKRAALGIACLLCLAPGAAEAKSTKRCAVRGAEVVDSNSQAIAYARDVSYDDLTDATEVWGCLRKRRKPVFVGAGESDQYGSTFIGPIVLSGTFIAYASSGGLIDGSCRSSVTVYSLVRDDEKGSAGSEGGGMYCPSVTQLLLSSRGLAAWTESVYQHPPRVRKLDNNDDRFLDEAAAANPSLAMSRDASGTVVTWTSADGTRRTKHLH
jgi:hypothetical protein